MIRQIRSEFVKALTGRAWWVLGLILVIVAPALSAFLVLAVRAAPSARLDIGSGDGTGVLYNLPASVAFVLPLVFGVVLVTGEYHSRTISQTFLGEPRRLVVFSAKLITTTALALALALVTMAATTAAVAATLSAGGDDPALTSAPVLTRIAGAVVTLTIWGLIGVGVGALVRNQLVAVVVVLAFTQFVEPLIRITAGAFGLGDVLAVLPGSASDSASGGTLLSMATGATGTSQAGGIAVLVAYAVVAALAGALRFRRSMPA
jgi:ABC-2 type transport system permease protein